MSRLFGAMATLIEVFREHAGKDGDASTLSKSEVKSLLTKEFGAKLDVSVLTSLHSWDLYTVDISTQFSA